MKNRLWLVFLPLLLVGFLACGLLLGCETGYTNGTGGGLGGSFTGLYTSPTGGLIVASTSGKPVSFFNLTQSGGDLSAVDNNGVSYQGTLSAVNITSATFTLQGTTSAGTAVTITGSLLASGSIGTLNGTWIEPSLTSTIYGTATITAFETTNTTAQLRSSPLSGTTLPLGLWFRLTAFR